tara:strand:+ start:163 stop:447 length:285 start_codon:yes stop_codon:yes gene_type:complete
MPVYCHQIEKNAEISYDYLLKKRFYNHGYLKYNVFKKCISHAIDSKSEYVLRKVFIYLIDNNLIQKRKNNMRSYNYLLLNPFDNSIKKEYKIYY